MTPCPQCGAIPQPSDKFCNICGTPVSPPGFGGQPQGGGFGAPPPGQGGFGAPPPAAYGAPPGPGGAGAAPLRCQMGHDIAPGASYCPHGHPIALDAMPFANDQYGGGGYGQQPPPGQGGFGAPPPGQGGFGAPPPQPGYGQPYPDPNAQYGGGGFGAPPPGQGGFGAPPPQPGYGAPGGFPDPNAGGGFGAPPPQQGFGGGQYAPPPPPQQGGFGAPPGQGFGSQGGFPAQNPGQGGFGAPPPAAEAPAPGTAPAIPANLPPNALRGFLVSYQSNTQGDFWALNGGRKTIGRANSGEQVDIPLSDATISSRHAAIVVDAAAGTVQIEDTGSTNGTFVNEEHIGFNGKRDLRDGDKIRFGGYTTIVKVVR